MTQPIRKELIDTWYDMALLELQADPDVRNDQLARAAFISNYIERMEADYRALKESRSNPEAEDPAIRGSSRRFMQI